MKKSSTSNRYFSLASLLSLALVMGACQAKEDESGLTLSDSDADALESAMTIVQGLADDASNGSFEVSQKPGMLASEDAEKPGDLNGESNPELASVGPLAACGRAVTQACSLGVRTISYSGCQAGSTFTLNGSVTLTYSTMGCALSAGENVVRTYDYTLTGPRGGSIQTTSTARSNYLGTSISGGGRVSQTGAAAWDISVLGKHKIGTRNGRTLFDVSVRTTTALSVTGAIGRSGRTVSAGTLVVDHNRARFTATYSVASGQPLVWQSSCAHPTSGALNVSYTGSISGAGTITFNGCGTAQLSKDSSTRTLSIGYAE